MPDKRSYILLVEDNADDEALTLRAFKKNSLHNEIVVVRDGVEALDFLFGMGDYAERNINDLPVIVLLDLKLPKIDGLQVLEKIRTSELTQLLPVIILTSSGEQEDLLRSYRLGANSYVRKPVDYNQFAETVEKLGLYWLVINERPR